MADQAGVDSEKQVAATAHVVESGDAVTSSAQGSSSSGRCPEDDVLGAGERPPVHGRHLRRSVRQDI